MVIKQRNIIYGMTISLCVSKLFKDFGRVLFANFVISDTRNANKIINDSVFPMLTKGQLWKKYTKQKK